MDKPKGHCLDVVAVMTISVTSIFMWEGFLLGIMWLLTLMVDLFNPYDSSFADSGFLLRVFLLFVAISIFFVILEIIAGACEDSSDRNKVYIVNLIVKMVPSGWLFYRSLPLVCNPSGAFISLAVLLVQMLVLLVSLSGLTLCLRHSTFKLGKT